MPSRSTNLTRLKTIGFQQVGWWYLSNDGGVYYKLRAEYASRKNILYGFAVAGEVTYLARTLRPLSLKMHGYQSPGRSARTNRRIHEEIVAAIRNGHDQIDIYALMEQSFLQCGEFRLSLAAALEDDIILQLKPKWNGGKKEVESPYGEDVETIEIYVSPA